MATQSVNHHPAFLVFPTVHSTFTWRIAAVSTNRTVSRHKSLGDVVAVCAFEDPRYEFPCGVKATVTDLDTRRAQCAKHAEVIYG